MSYEIETFAGTGAQVKADLKAFLDTCGGDKQPFPDSLNIVPDGSGGFLGVIVYMVVPVVPPPA